MDARPEHGGARTRSPRLRRDAHDPTGCGKLSFYSLRGCTLSTTCEPCPMCMACALWARLDRLVNEATRRGRGPLCPSNSDSCRGGRKAAPDMTCVVDRPVERDVGLALFTNPSLQKTFKRWNS